MAGYLGSKAVLLSTTAANVAGNASITGDLTLGGNATFGDNDKAIFGAGSDLQIYHDGSHSYIQDTGTGNLRIKSENFQVLGNADNEAQIETYQNDGVYLYFDGSQKFATTSTGVDVTGTITGSGNLVVGTTGVPNVGAGQTGFSVSSTEMVFSSNTNGSNALSYWRTQSGNSYVASYWNGNSNVGSIFVTTTSTLYNTSSDYRLKEDVQPMVGASDRVLALNPVNFAWKVNGERVDGFLAHEAQAVVPEAVTGEKDAVDDEGNPKYQGIDQSKLVPLLTAALQEALTKIDALETRIAALEGN